MCIYKFFLTFKIKKNNNKTFTCTYFFMIIVLNLPYAKPLYSNNKFKRTLKLNSKGILTVALLSSFQLHRRCYTTNTKIIIIIIIC